MYLTIRHKNEKPKELRFRTGPIYIGRQLGSQVFLPDKAVSRQHAVIYATKDGKWVLEDLDSANKTYLNGSAVHKAAIKDGDIFLISDFSIQVQLHSVSSRPAAINMGDTLITASREMRSITRSLDDVNAPMVRLPSSRMKDFARMSCEICKAHNKEELLNITVAILKRQIRVNRIWVGFAESPGGEIEYQLGRVSSGQTIELASLPLQSEIVRAKESMEFVLVPRLKLEPNPDKIRSAIIAPIVYEKQCMGIIYIDNTLHQEAYSIESLNYLMLAGINLGMILNRL